MEHVSTQRRLVKSPPERVTPHVESFQAVLWHALVSHPALEAQPGKWEAVQREQVAPR